MYTDRDKTLARRWYSGALKILREEQLQLAHTVSKYGRELKQYPGANTLADIDGLSQYLKRARRDVKIAQNNFAEKRKRAMKLGVSHPGDKYGGKLSPKKKANKRK